MPEPHFELACGWYDRTEPLRDGRIKPEGFALRIHTYDDPRVLFDKVVGEGAFDAAEMSSAEHISMTAQGDNPFVGIPVFTSRVFRHSFICLNKKAGIHSPRDLARKRIGVPLFSMSAAVWCRGLLRDEYGVDLSQVTWVEGAIDKPGSHGVSPPMKAAGATIVRNEASRSLTDLLETGEIDATLGALMPTTFGRSENIVRLFPNFREVERDYFSRTRLHPIMHLIVLRRTSVARHRHAPQALYEAFARAKRIALDRMFYTGAPKTMLPLLHAEVEETRSLFGSDPWPDGVEANRNTLETGVRYMFEDGLIPRRPALHELFTPVHETFRV